MRSKSRFTTLVLLELRESYLQIRVRSLRASSGSRGGIVLPMIAKGLPSIPVKSSSGMYGAMLLLLGCEPKRFHPIFLRWGNNRPLHNRACRTAPVFHPRADVRSEKLEHGRTILLPDFRLLRRELGQARTAMTDLIGLLIETSGVAPSARREVGFDGLRLPAWLFPAPRPRGTTVIFGGFDSYIEEFFPILVMLQRKGFNVIAFEGPGHGRDRGNAWR